jgi:glycopeptide antibiotics resistance protein
MMLLRPLFALFVAATAAVLLTTPFAAGFTTRPFSCDLGPSPDWVETIFNLKHILVYGVLATIAFLAFRKQPVWVPILVVLITTAGVELTQAFFNDGHCRVRDMIPNVIAIGLGWSLAWVAMRRLPRWGSP